MTYIANNIFQISINVNGNLEYVNGHLRPVHGNLGPVNGNLGPLKNQQFAVIIGNLLFFGRIQQIALFSIKCLI